MCGCDRPLSRRQTLIGGATLGAASLTPALIPVAQAGLPLPPGEKPDTPFLFRLGRKPTPPAGAETEAAGIGTTAPAGAPPHRTLALDNINTGEKLTVTYMERGRYLPDALQEINHLMRDRRSGDVAPIDPALLDLISDLCLRLESRAPVRLISGYRAPETNSRMRSQDRAVARRSYHTRGMAADIALPGRSLGDLRRAAVSLSRGGVGSYPSSGFVHVDVGPPRTWNG
ncbi:DUF882 domain-containing protein [Roseospira navarrensis]|uniref:DUF882 domain-containing protein n=1 Tax=Roseospira navarrensis TaxID=140058 RepID=UPI0014788BCB